MLKNLTFLVSTTAKRSDLFVKPLATFAGKKEGGGKEKEAKPKSEGKDKKPAGDKKK